MKKLWCLGFYDFKDLAYENKWDEKVPKNIAIISINNGEYTCPANEYHICKEADNVLNLNFDDADPNSIGLPEDMDIYTFNSNGEDITLTFLTSEIATKAVKFIENNKDKNFYIHCSAGISRSQAFVKYIKNVYHDYCWEINPNNPCIHPNGFVFQKLMQAFRNR